MENCLYKGNVICTFDLKDDSGLYYEDIVLEWKQAASKRLLTCIECGAPVYLAAGPMKEPYFAHYDIEDCDYSNAHETEELKIGKRLLYRLLKQSFPNDSVQARFRMENGMYSTLLCQTESDIPIAVDYRLQNNSLEKFQRKDSFYQENHIRPFYVMGIRQDKTTKQLDWYQNLIQTSMGYLVFLDTASESMILKKSFSYRIGRVRHFSFCKKTYPLKELQLSSSGQMICDFSEECVKIEMQIREEKLHFQRKQEKIKELRENQQRNELIEKERLEKYRRSQISALDPNLMEKCRKMMEEGNAHLVSKKYYNAIMDRVT